MMAYGTKNIYTQGHRNRGQRGGAAIVPPNIISLSYVSWARDHGA